MPGKRRNVGQRNLDHYSDSQIKQNADDARVRENYMQGLKGPLHVVDK